MRIEAAFGGTKEEDLVAVANWVVTDTAGRCRSAPLRCS